MATKQFPGGLPIITPAINDKLLISDTSNSGEWSESEIGNLPFAPALGADDNYVTDAEKIVIGNTSGTNTGDQDLSGYAPLASPTFTGTTTIADLKITGGTPGAGKVLTSDADGDASWTTPTTGSTYWTEVPGSPTRTGNTTFTITGDYTSIFAKGVILKWTESSVVKCAMISIPSTYGAPNTTVTIIGDTMASIDASSLKYTMESPYEFNFAVAGSISATGTDIANSQTAFRPMRVIGAELSVGTVAATSGNTVVDINNGGTTMFTAKPTLAYNVRSSATPATADSGTSLALGDEITIDIDTVTATTFPLDLYVKLYTFPTYKLNLT